MRQRRRVTVEQQQRRALDEGARAYCCPRCKDLVWLDSAQRVDVRAVELVCGGCAKRFDVAGYGKAYRSKT